MPDDYARAEKLIASIKAKFDANPDSYFTESEALKNDDLVLVGTIIQIYGYADLNARRIIDMIRHAALGPAHQNGAKIQDAQVYVKLVEAAKLLPEGNLREGLVKAATSLQMHVIHRHHFAHWATRRVKGHDVFVMFTYNAKEAKKLGFDLEPDHVVNAVMAVPPLRAQLKNLRGHDQWLAEEAARISKNFDAFKKHFDEQKEAERLAKYEAGKFKGRGKGGPQK